MIKNGKLRFSDSFFRGEYRSNIPEIEIYVDGTWYCFRIDKDDVIYVESNIHEGDPESKEYYLFHAKSAISEEELNEFTIEEIVKFIQEKDIQSIFDRPLIMGEDIINIGSGRFMIYIMNGPIFMNIGDFFEEYEKIDGKYFKRDKHASPKGS